MPYLGLQGLGACLVCLPSLRDRQARKRALARTDPAGTLSSNFQPPELWDRKCLQFKPSVGVLLWTKASCLSGLEYFSWSWFLWRFWCLTLIWDLPFQLQACIHSLASFLFPAYAPSNIHNSLGSHSIQGKFWALAKSKPCCEFKWVL